MSSRPVFLALVLLAGSAAAAGEPPAPAASATVRPALAAAPVSAQALLRSRGGSDAGTTTVQTTLDGSVGQNQAVNVTSGQNVIGGGAFAHLSGVPVVIQNSGSNVLIQNATTVNVTVR